ncbi:hypothetical protein MD484_g5120, partial [Candolleomyces efflorescens]
MYKHTIMQQEEKLQFSDQFWNGRLKESLEWPLSEEAKCHLVFSLLAYLKLPLLNHLSFIFQSNIHAVKQKVGIFMGTKGKHFGPAVIFEMWHAERYSKARAHLHKMIHECGQHIVLEESNNILEDKELQVKMSEVNDSTFSNMLGFDKQEERIRSHAPFLWSALTTFSSSPNRYRRRMGLGEVGPGADGDEQQLSQDPEFDDDPNFDERDPAAERSRDVAQRLQGFTRDPRMAIFTALAMLVFVRNRATNLLPFMNGMFFKIEGTSSRVMSMLSNVGLSVSSRTVERTKEQISEDAIRRARELMNDENSLHTTIFDNINLYLRKHQQRVTNRNTMIHATNSAIIKINAEGIDIPAATNLPQHLALRGERKKANFGADILPSEQDHTRIRSSSILLVAEMLVRYTPESKRWKGRGKMLKAITEKMPHDDPLPVEKTDTRPFGVFDVNEGSKKGIVEVLDQIRERAGMSDKEWGSKVRFLSGDWLTSSNFRAARRDRRDDVNAKERLEYGQEISQLFHFALQATQKLIRTHYGDKFQDPTSLGAHKGLLGRVWDVNKANYAAAKSLVRHSTIARILHIVMSIKGFRFWSELSSWEPKDLDEVLKLAEKIVDDYGSTAAAEKAKGAGDDWAAHDAYFIRDALLFCEFEFAVSYADAPAVLRVLRYWCLAFRGAGQHNYARECVEILLKWKYELSPGTRTALARSWFVNRWGLPGRWIAADLYLEQLNFLVKRVFIARGNGVTVAYIMKKGSACVEAFRSISTKVANFFGSPENRRRSKEISFQEDLRVLVEEMERQNLHRGYQQHFVPAPSRSKATSKKTSKSPVSAISDIQVRGAEIWQDGKFSEFKQLTMYDPALGYVIGTFSDDAEVAPGVKAFTLDTEAGSEVDIFGEIGNEGMGGIGGGEEFDTGEEEC